MTYTEQDVLNNMGLVHSVAEKYKAASGGVLDYDDLLQDGRIGLIEALERFDPSKGFTFSTFAWSYIQGNILQGNRRMFSERWRAKRRGEFHADPVSLHGVDRDTDEESAHQMDVFTSDQGVQAGDIFHRADISLSIPKIMDIKSKRDREIAQAIFDHPELQQNEVAKLLGISRQRVSLVWRSMEINGLARLEQKARDRQKQYKEAA